MMDIHCISLWPVRKGSLLQSVREREEARDTIAVFQVISVHLGMQVCKNDIILLTTLNCLKFPPPKKKSEERAHRHQLFIIGHKIFVTHFTCNHDSPVCHYTFIYNSFVVLS